VRNCTPPPTYYYGHMRTVVLFILIPLALIPIAARAQASLLTPVPAVDSAYEPLTKAFDALRLHDYDAAIPFFRDAAALSPRRADIRKNLAYTLLKTGDSDSARDEFGEAVRLDPADFHAALEYAFLCFEAKDDVPARKAEARRIFAKVRDSGDAESRSTADAAFHNIDDPLRSAIERWRQALADSTPTFSAHYELAQLAEQRDEFELASANYKSALRLIPERRAVLLELARVAKTQGDANGMESMIAALLAASRGPEPRTAELAREQLPARYPYVYEFRQALELDPGNEALHQELSYLLLRMSETGQASREDAEEEFSKLADLPDNYLPAAQLGLLYLEDHHTELAMPLLNRVLAHGNAATANRVRMALHMPLIVAEIKEASISAERSSLDPRVLGERSYQAGFMKDALRYFMLARDANPQDASIALKLGWTNNLLHDDVTALRWFNVAQQSADAAVATEAKRAYNNLKPERRRFRTTVWLYPLYSSRWSDLFGYGQVKTELRVKSVPLHPYASIRLAGDVRRTTGGPLPQNLSESAFITALGVATDTWRGATAWFEAGVASSYLTFAHWSDYRGGISYARTHGAALGAEHAGWFLETTGDSVYISHFDEDLINYAQGRIGYTTTLAGVPTQAFWSQNFTFDVKGQYWANFMETGPAFRIHPPGTPRPMWINVSALHGVYLRNGGNPGRPNFNDIRIGIWYAFTK
jgi:tetratricopeptide (TPR) repeat protein